MPPRPASNPPERMEEAAENLRKILREIAPYEHKPKVAEVSTTGTWRTSEASIPQIVGEN